MAFCVGQTTDPDLQLRLLSKHNISIYKICCVCSRHASTHHARMPCIIKEKFMRFGVKCTNIVYTATDQN